MAELVKQMQRFREAAISANSIGIMQFINPTKLDIESFIILIMFVKFAIISVTISIYST